MVRSPRQALVAALLIAFSCVLSAQVPVQAQRVAGKVVDAKTGRPLARAQVSLEKIGSDLSVGQVVSDGDGSFHFPDAIPAGKYRLQASARGYIASAYLQHGQLSTAIVTGAGLPTADLRLALTAAASITGRVVDERGDPVADAMMLLFRSDTEAGTLKTYLVNSRPADDNGSYEFDAVRPGRYYLAAKATPWYAVHPPPENQGEQQSLRVSIDPALDVAYPTTFYPAAVSKETAVPFDLTEGEQMIADMQMVPQHALTLTLRRNGSNSPPSQVFQSLFGFEQPMQLQVNMSGNEETIAGLPPGQYTLREYPATGNRMPLTTGTVDLTNGSVVREASPVPSFASLTVSLRSTGTEPLLERTVVTLVSPLPGGAVSNPVNEKGDAEFQDLPPGEYRLRIAGNRHPDLPVSTLTVNGRPIADLRLRVAEAGHLNATVVLSGAPVTVEGFAVRNGKAGTASLILLVPAGADTDTELFRRDQSDLDGSFSLAGVVPGKYLLLAIDDAWSIPWTDLHALTPYLLHAQPIVVPSDGRTTLRLTSPVAAQPLR